MKNSKVLLQHQKFANEKGLLVDGEYEFKTLADANEYARLRCEWWGSNLVYLGAEAKGENFYPMFNVFD